MDESHNNTDTSLTVEPSVNDFTPDVSMETSKDSEWMDQTRKHIELDMDPRYNYDHGDPVERLEPVRRLLHKISPLQGLIYIRLTSEHLYHRQKKNVKKILIIAAVLLFVLYLGAALRHNFGDEGSIRLLVITLLVVFCVSYYFLKKRFGTKVYQTLIAPASIRIHRYKRLIKLILTIAVTLAVVLYVVIDTSLRRPASLVSGLGIVIFITLMFFFSKDPRQVVWRPILWGMLLQFLFAIVVLRTDWGYELFVWLGDRVTDYLKFADAGSKFIFGDNFMDHFFAFSVMPVLIFFSSTISILYYLGLIQLLIEKIAALMEASLGTGPMESLHAAINIFVGWGEAVVVVRPLLDKMSLSELHTVMTNGFATVAGSTLAIYILFGAPANHLLSASVMSAPAALAMSKLFYPETKENRHRKRDDECKIPKTGSGIIDAASIGAVGAISIVSYILASVIAFFSLLAFVNATLQWLGERVGLSPPDYPPLSFELICSYLFWPIVFLMGVVPEDCRIVARMVGVKTFINEFLAYEDLGRVKRNRKEFEKMFFNGSLFGANGTMTTWHFDGSSNLVLEESGVVLLGGVISPHSEMIATYALCGFSNIVALGIMIGALTAVAPSRKDAILKVSFRALISGCMACFLTACIAVFQTETYLTVNSDWEKLGLWNNRFLEVNEFKGELRIDLREWDDDKPKKKGSASP